MRARLFVIAVLSTFGALVPSLAGCAGDGVSDGGTRSNWTSNPELIDFCENYCSTMTCADARGQGCLDYCEFWLEGLNDKCGDEIRATLACQAQLTCKQFYAFWDDDPRSDANCGTKFAAQVTACGDESPACEAYCTHGESCDPDAEAFCHDNCRLRQGWFLEYYGETCHKASAAVMQCESEVTCAELQALQSDGTVPKDCQDEQAAFDAACKK